MLIPRYLPSGFLSPAPYAGYRVQIPDQAFDLACSVLEGLSGISLEEIMTLSNMIGDEFGLFAEQRISCAHHARYLMGVPIWGTYSPVGSLGGGKY